MSSLARTNSGSKRPQYKDYVTFLDSYKNGKDYHSVTTSDSGVNFSLTNSSNNSSSSVFSDVSDGSRNGFKETLHHDIINQKSRSPNPVSHKNEPKQIVKTEMYIEIKNEPVQPHFATRVFEVDCVDNSGGKLSVSTAAKIFEQNKRNEMDGQTCGTQGLKPKRSFSRKSSIEQISKKFETEEVKHPSRKSKSIGEVSKIFENNSKPPNGTLNRPKNFNNVPKPFPNSNVQKLNQESRSITIPLTKPALSPKPMFQPPQFPKYIPEDTRSNHDSVDSALSSLSISPSPPQSISPPPVSNLPVPGSFSVPPPPPPPLPSANFSSKPANNGFTRSPQPNKVPIQKVTVSANGASPNGTIDKNDPRVKKAVYGALRNMYGAYHDQANDYLATLPKNRVKKNNGLDNIINSIASQGGLEKLTGRGNPNPEME